MHKTYSSKPIFGVDYTKSDEVSNSGSNSACTRRDF